MEPPEVNECYYVLINCSRLTPKAVVRFSYEIRELYSCFFDFNSFLLVLPVSGVTVICASLICSACDSPIRLPKAPMLRGAFGWTLSQKLWTLILEVYSHGLINPGDSPSVFLDLIPTMAVSPDLIAISILSIVFVGSVAPGTHSYAENGWPYKCWPPLLSFGITAFLTSFDA